MFDRPRRPAARPIARILVAAASCGSVTAHAAFLSGEALDTAANALSWVVIFLVPIVGIVVFWLVHVLPEKIAHKRHHPQRDAIQTLCLLSLVFGGLLWPLAWLWAYTRPTFYKSAFGTDKHDDYFTERVERAQSGELLSHELAHLESELDAMDARAALTPELRKLRDDIAAARNGKPAEVAKAGDA